ncbi:hypothetical protein IscW_ISCW017977 [Ixodes scapularis]|uniref:Uncharacterized protein n=1 Tax=Ixodes scapularis TaxID=6945 RepID=B7PIC4_IXOSC|nr:hypothetical protein IscW_ISCW017977 [Ixodes scapularis]|eukprot:XP_002404805.1 hypothetical protein IscW_ISCW017977 [Ixodes scapularis]
MMAQVISLTLPYISVVDIADDPAAFVKGGSGDQDRGHNLVADQDCGHDRGQDVATALPRAAKVEHGKS